MKKNLNIFTLALSGMVVFSVGVIILVQGAKLLEVVMVWVSYAFIVVGISQGVKVLIFPSSKEERITNLSNAAFNVVLGLLMLRFQKFSLSLLPMAFGLYTIANGFVKLIVFILYSKNRVRGNFRILIECVIFLAFGTITLFFPLIHINEIMVIIGCYCILYSFTFVLDLARELVPLQTKNKLKRKFRISLPVFLVMLIPIRTLESVNAYLKPSEEPDHIPDYEEKKGEEEPDIEVLIHVTQDGFGAIGHVDFILGETAISYGNYDIESLKLFQTIGDGVLFTASKKEYIPFCIRTSQKTLFGFGLKLSKEEMEAVQKQIDHVKGNLYPWDSPYTTQIKKGNKVDLTDYTDYASEIETTIDAKLYKFKQGKFKTYFTLGTNCVLLADYVLGGAGTDIVKLNGVISPGGYFDWLDREFRRKGSKVITKRIYN